MFGSCLLLRLFVYICYCLLLFWLFVVVFEMVGGCVQCWFWLASLTVVCVLLCLCF